MGFCSLSPPGTKTAMVSLSTRGRRPPPACREVCLEEECPSRPGSWLLTPRSFQRVHGGHVERPPHNHRVKSDSKLESRLSLT